MRAGCGKTQRAPADRPAPSSQRDSRMTGRAAEEGGGRGVLTDVRALEMMLDYAILEGAELRLPLFVLLLRAARLELMTGAGAGARRGDIGRDDRGMADEAACVSAARDVLDSCSHLIQDR